MIDIDDLVDAWVEQLRAIPALVVELGGDETRIIGYKDIWPTKNDVTLAIYQLLPPAVMVISDGRVSAREGMGFWDYPFRLVFRPDEQTTSERLIRAAFRGGGSVGSDLYYQEVHSSCLPINGKSFEQSRVTLMVTETSRFDFTEVRLTLTEIGDQ